jgi:hypothetical protein
MKIIKSFNFKRAKSRKDKFEEGTNKSEHEKEKIKYDNKINSRRKYRNKSND